MSTSIPNKKLPEYPATLKRAARKSLILAADWGVHNQVRDAWPAWNANKGRFPYHVVINPVKRAKQAQPWSTCWNTSRMAQGLYSAYCVTGLEPHLAAANLAMEYVATLQVFEPGYETFHGSFFENSPQGPHIATRDTMEAVQGFIAGYYATKTPRFLRRAVAGADFLLRAMRSKAWPYPYVWLAENRIKNRDFFFFYACVLVFAQMYVLTGNRNYLKQGVVPFSDKILREYIRPDGAFGVKGPVTDNHHVHSEGELAGVFVNDDGLGVALLAAYAVTGSQRYLDAAIGSADFWARTSARPEMLAVYPSVALFLADVHRLTGDSRYLPRIKDYIQENIALQCLATKEPFLRGAFIGEDMATVYNKNSHPKDYVCLRITSYSLMALAKVAAEKPAQWGCAYSCFGW